MQLPQKYRRPVLFALLLHVALLFVLIFNFAPTVFRMPPASAPMQTIQARAIIEPSAAEHRVRQQQAQEKKIEEQAEAKKELMEARAKTSALAAKQAKLTLEQKQKTEKSQQQKLAVEKIEKAKQAEKAQKLKAAKLAAKKQQTQKLLTEQKKLQQAMMQQQMNTEAKNVSAAVSQAQQGAIDQYKAQILALIQSNWRIDQVNSQLKCIYTVALAPDGTVLSIALTQSSGNQDLDQSAKQAIEQSSPLPVPHNLALFNHFRQLVLTLSPQGYLQSVGNV
ncbi:MAG: protein TolA [Gammaproteobacteria bacterium RIFCSPHIGHO2_02_FULL_39_13]|nr:MAG: protein TolA [Gammaproteobacteria bacterium RIFCSPHIGHO2_02_FULL_39_13]OGT50545.1 MAG: protein TolA [Gammaproteobacteria bacterium RIFCSPHIGHO2_12_FULL_39_24]